MVFITAIVTVASLAAGPTDPQRPDWAAETVPDTIVTLVERAADTDGDERKELLREAERHARESLAEGDDIGRRYALAVVLALRANAEGGRTKVQTAAALSEQLDLILTAEPHHVGARHMLGRLHAGIRRMGTVSRWLAKNVMGAGALADATWEEAERNLAYAEQQAPWVADHHLQLALLYRDTGRPQLASMEVSHALDIEPRNALEHAVREEALKVRSELGQ